MNHPTADQLLLLAYSELPEPQVGIVEAHVGACDACRAELARLERARVALDIALPRRRRMMPWLAVGLAAAAVLAAVVFTNVPPPRPAGDGWRPVADWSATAGYVAGGRATVEIDAQLTRLERERSYGLPN